MHQIDKFCHLKWVEAGGGLEPLDHDLNVDVFWLLLKPDVRFA